MLFQPMRGKSRISRIGWFEPLNHDFGFPIPGRLLLNPDQTGVNVVNVLVSRGLEVNEEVTNFYDGADKGVDWLNAMIRTLDKEALFHFDGNILLGSIINVMH